MTNQQETTRDYPPLPTRRRQFLCTKCGGRECEPGTLNETHPTCKCGYLGFAEDLDFTTEQMRAYVDADRSARSTTESVLEDAERYRWLRNNRPDYRDLVAIIDLRSDVSAWLSHEYLDKAIDAAMKESK